MIASPHQSGIVQSINGGRVSIATDRLPKLGQRVKKGELLAIVEPPVNAADETTIADKLGEITQQIMIAEVRLLRLMPLAAANAVPKNQVTDLQTELESLRKRQANIPTRRRQPEELRAPVDGEVAAVRVVAGQVVAPQDQSVPHRRSRGECGSRRLRSKELRTHASINAAVAVETPSASP